MATLRTINKQVGTPLEVAAVIRRLATPAIIQPTYTFDVSDLGWYVFDGVDTYERVLNNQYFALYGTNGITVMPPTKTGNIVWQEIDGAGINPNSFPGAQNASFGHLSVMPVGLPIDAAIAGGWVDPSSYTWWLATSPLQVNGFPKHAIVFQGQTNPADTDPTAITLVDVDGKLFLRDSTHFYHAQARNERFISTNADSYVDQYLKPTLDSNYHAVTTSNYTLNVSDHYGYIEASGNITITLPATDTEIFSGFQCNIINVGNGVITLNASTLMTTDSSIRIRDKYAAVTVVNKHYGSWYAFGNLK